ncbi:beta-N-acetylhexosaminidase [Bacillus infantis]|uniref:beta-N-acetylhexosaminidase n=1 Tax=Bacillus infantis TaxID=324767 RepID=UPI00101E22C2|nr:beta-N-acetylhexosaminidase [Bacillus infantis]RYI28696.1 beta-N-acetylhexosaminidase [Bacillus infantis]
MNSNWSLKEKIGQMFIIAFAGEEMNPELERAIAELNVGGVILFQRNLKDAGKVKQLNKDIQRIARMHNRPPLWISIDQEGGGIAYLWEGMAISPGNMLIGAAGNAENAYDASYLMGLQLMKLGFNMNFAPDIDINNNPKNPVIGARSFGETTEMVSMFGQKSIEGYRAAGMLAVGKHFPGHGDTEFDSHLSLPKVEKNLEELERFELLPFIENIQTGMEAIMTAHIVYPKLDPDHPATLSSFFLKKLLREKYRFDGLILTDSMEMQAISKFFGREAGTVKAVQAGADIILACGRDVAAQQLMIEAVEKAVADGQISEERIDSAVGRISAFKQKWIKSQEPAEEELPEVHEKTNHDRMEQIALEGITLLFDRKGLLPLSSEASVKIISQRTYNDENYVGDRKAVVHQVFNEGRYEIHYIDGANPSVKEVDELSDSVKEEDFVLLLINERRTVDENWVNLYEGINRITGKIILVSLWNPQIISAFPADAAAYIAAYSNTSHTVSALKKLVEGRAEFRGKLPVTIPPFAEEPSKN